MKTALVLRHPLALLSVCALVLTALPQRAEAGFLCGLFKSKPSGNGCLLTGALDSVAEQTGRKVVVVNPKGCVVASSCEKVCPKSSCSADKKAPKGHIYVNNQNTGAIYPEITQTLKDGQTRVFKATGPDGKAFKKTITALRNAKNQIIGAVIVVTPVKG